MINNTNTLIWYSLSVNLSAIYLIEQNFDKISWYNLSKKSNSIHLLEQNFNKIDWEWLSENPNIFERDYTKMSKIRTWIKLEDLMKYALHPYVLSGLWSWNEIMMIFNPIISE